MADRFDLEHQIMNCWNVVDDIKLLNENVQEGNPSTDYIANYLLGLETIYQAKFEKLFNTFEQLIRQRELDIDAVDYDGPFPKMTPADLFDFEDKGSPELDDEDERPILSIQEDEV